MGHILNKKIIEQTIEAISGEDLSEGTKVMCDIIILYKEKTIGRIEQLHELYSKHDWKQLHFECHSLKSASGAVGAETMMDLCERIEQFSRDGHSPELAPLMSQLDPLWSALLQELDLCIKRLQTIEEADAAD